MITTHKQLIFIHFVILQCRKSRLFSKVVDLTISYVYYHYTLYAHILFMLMNNISQYLSRGTCSYIRHQQIVLLKIQSRETINLASIFKMCDNNEGGCPFWIWLILIIVVVLAFTGIGIWFGIDFKAGDNIEIQGPIINVWIIHRPITTNWESMIQTISSNR